MHKKQYNMFQVYIAEVQKNGCESCKIMREFGQHSSKDTNTAMWPSSETKVTIINRA